MTKLDGSCPKCGKFAYGEHEREEFHNTKMVLLAQCLNCQTMFRETYSLTKSEVITDG